MSKPEWPFVIECVRYAMFVVFGFLVGNSVTRAYYIGEAIRHDAAEYDTHTHKLKWRR